MNRGGNSVVSDRSPVDATPRARTTAATTTLQETTDATNVQEDETNVDATTYVQRTVQPEQEEVDLFNMHLLALCISSQAEAQRPTDRLLCNEQRIESELVRTIELVYPLVIELEELLRSNPSSDTIARKRTVLVLLLKLICNVPEYFENDGTCESSLIFTVDDLVRRLDIIRWCIYDLSGSPQKRTDDTLARFIAPWSVLGSFFYRFWSQYIQCDYDSLCRTFARTQLDRNLSTHLPVSCAVKNYEPFVATELESALLAYEEGLSSISENDKSRISINVRIPEQLKTTSPLIQLLVALANKDELTAHVKTHEYFDFCSPDSCPAYAYFGSVGLANLCLRLKRRKLFERVQSECAPLRSELDRCSGTIFGKATKPPYLTMNVSVLPYIFPAIHRNQIRNSVCLCLRRDIEQSLANSKASDDERLLNAKLVQNTHPLLSYTIKNDVLASQGLPHEKPCSLSTFNRLIANLNYEEAGKMARSMYPQLTTICLSYLDLVRRENVFQSLATFLESSIVEPATGMITFSLNNVAFDNYCYLNKLPIPGIVRAKQMIRNENYQQALQCLATECVEQLTFWGTCKGAFLYLKSVALLGIATKNFNNSNEDNRENEFVRKLNRIITLLKQSHEYLRQVGDTKILLASYYLTARVCDRVHRTKERNDFAKRFCKEAQAIEGFDRDPLLEEDFLIF